MVISYSGFWQGFSSRAFFDPLLAESLKGLPKQGDYLRVEVHSVFEVGGLRGVARRLRRLPRDPSALRIWYSGEWRTRPPGFDLGLSFRSRPESGDIYLPVAYLGLDWFGNPSSLSLEASRSGRFPHPHELARERLSSTSNRPGFACAFIGNPTPDRMHVIERLGDLGHVDVFGSAVGRPVPGKFEIAQRYRFMLCFENQVQPGYVTEKPIDAWVAGCVPLWSGHDAFKLLNPDAVMNRATFQNDEEFINAIRELDQDPDAIDRMTSLPLTHQPWSLTHVLDAIASTARRVTENA